MTSRNNYSPNIAYFAMRRTIDSEGHIGAALVVDGKGIPTEFRCTVPVRPTAVQTALYGASIRDFIALELCGHQLLQVLTTSPAFCLVESEPELNLQTYISIPVFHVRRVISPGRSDIGEGDRRRGSQYRQTLQSRQPGGASVVPNDEHDEETPEGYIRLDSPANFAPTLVNCCPGWERSLQDFLPDLQLFFSTIDLIEPFERITAGCRLLSQQDERFK